jgi:CheY-like chemotaxis protein
VLRILVVDDEADVRTMVSVVLGFIVSKSSKQQAARRH